MAEAHSIEDFDLLTREGRRQARKHGFDVPKRTAGVKPKPFESLIEKTDGCWLWRGTVNHRTGYGFYNRGGRSHRAHRWALAEHFGRPIPAEMVVCHRCDVKLCVRPDHLFLGTHQDNIADKVSKGRQVSGERNPAAKLTREQAEEIRRYFRLGVIQTRLAEKYQVSRRTIFNIVNGTIWR